MGSFHTLLLFFTAIKFMAIKIDTYEILRPNGRTAGFA